MTQYTAPLKDMHFALSHIAGFEALSRRPGLEDWTPDVAVALLSEAARFAGTVFSPLNEVGDREGVRWSDGEVTMPAGFKEAYTRFVADGWNAIMGSPEYGGQGMPRVLSALIEEMLRAANLAFSGCSTLTMGAIRAIELNGSDVLKKTYLPGLIRGDWTGTMNLTEPQAGSDLSAIRTRAEPRGDGTYRLYGQKIFISWGEHDLSDNIIHLVLARTPDAPAGTRGLSLFLVPKLLLDANGTPAVRNDVQCLSIEHKLGQHAAPNTVMAFGEKGGTGLDGPGAVGYLIGTETRGLEYMFVMMNEARFSVGLEGVSLADRAYQSAVAYARERIQGTEAGVKGGPRVPIIRHPDVRRMLMWMKSHTEAARAIALAVAASTDVAHYTSSTAEREQAHAFVDLMTPVVKGWSTENAVTIASLCIQIHGGMGYMEKTGVAQFWRDSRIAPIYEGTTAIQANDLVGRKVARDAGVTIRRVIDEVRSVQQELSRAGASAPLTAIAAGLDQGVTALGETVDFILAHYATETKRVLAGAVPFLQLFSSVVGGWQLARGALAAHAILQGSGVDAGFYRTKIQTARFFADHVLCATGGLAQAVRFGADSVIDVDEDEL